MLTIRIVTIQGETVQLEVMQAEYVVVCPYCEIPFRTTDPDKKYCKVSHSVRMSERRRIIRESCNPPNTLKTFLSQ